MDFLYGSWLGFSRVCSAYSISYSGRYAFLYGRIILLSDGLYSGYISFLEVYAVFCIGFIELYVLYICVLFGVLRSPCNLLHGFYRSSHLTFVCDI